MFEVVEKMILAGVGFAHLTKEKAEKFVDTLIAKGQLQAKDKKAVLNKLLTGTKQLDQQLEQRMKQIALGVTSNTEKLVKNTEKQVEALQKKIGKLSGQLEAARRKQQPVKPAASGKKPVVKKTAAKRSVAKKS